MKVNYQQLEAIGENWYQRTNKLVSYYQDSKNPVEKREKAFDLSVEMTRRVLSISQEIMKRQQPKKVNFPKGGIHTISNESH